MSASATGTVTFYEGSTELGTGTISDGVATYTTTALAEGTQTLTAVYGGDTTYEASTSAAISVVVSESLTTTTTTLSSSTTDTIYGASVTLTALLSATAASGTVTFYNGTTILGTSTLSAGVAALTITTLSVGTNNITATYIGDSVYASSTSGSVAITIAAVTASNWVTRPGDHAVLVSQLLTTVVQKHDASEYAKFREMKSVTALREVTFPTA